MIAASVDLNRMKQLFTAVVTSKGGRSGTVRSADGTINTQLGNPLDKQGPEGPNPETFFAAAYSACFHGALQNAAKKHGAVLTNSSISVRASLNEDDADGYFLSIEILAEMPGLDKAKEEQILSSTQNLPLFKTRAGGSAG